MWDDLFRALALVLVIEGLLPFAAPARWRETMLRLASLDDRQLRFVGVSAIVGGMIILQLVRLL
ncbi:DUF2065 domain-containing protein [Algiphilus sp.]|uniref:DUF2065 domain-containing protein n=1 Tax=Algiphilus sp. TaxID=1872431 RepID=UPI0025C519B3|nr:DUF2065 domain-containing protein [Algiphilus sp.]MCK5769625.1 DUF2065 domain-containing protein [Algiphilus sp.]